MCVYDEQEKKGKKERISKRTRAYLFIAQAWRKEEKDEIFSGEEKKMKKGYFTGGEFDFDKISPNMSRGGSKKITMAEMDQSTARMRHTKKKTDLNEV